MCALLSSIKFSRLFHHLIVLKLSINLLKTFTFKVICVLCFVSNVCAHLHFLKSCMTFSFSQGFKVVGISKKNYLSKPCWKFHQVPYLTCCVHSFIHVCKKLHWLPNLLHIVLFQACWKLSKCFLCCLFITTILSLHA